MIYEPAEDSFMLAAHIPSYVKGKSFLDLGTGSGIQARTARDAGAQSVLASDIHRRSLQKVASEGIETRYSNLFSGIKGKFDVIAFNPPYLPHDGREDKETARVTTGGARGDELVCRFLQSVRSHLRPRGVALIILSSLTPRDHILRLLKEKKFKARRIDTKRFFMESIELWEVMRKLS